jgi:thermitase
MKSLRILGESCLIALFIAVQVWGHTWASGESNPATGEWRAAAPVHQATGEPSSGNESFVPGEVLVGYRLAPRHREESRSSADEILAADPALADVQVLAPLDLWAEDSPMIGQRLRVPEGEEWAVIAALRANPAVVFAEPNWMVHASGLEQPAPFVPNDPRYGDKQWYLQRINASRAWAVSFGGMLQVAVVDTGIDFQHPEFQGRLLNGQNYIAPLTLPQDDSGHGTHVTGVIAAAVNNGAGIAGLAPQIVIDPRKVLDSNNNGTIANVAQAIRDAADAGARIINLSLETSVPSDTLRTAVDYAAGRGVLMIASVGNLGISTVQWPAAFPSVIAVAATDRFDQRTYYSNYGPEVDLAAPGGLSNDPIDSTWPPNTFCNGIFQFQSGYCTAVGSSMSAALVSGVAALIWGMRPELSAAQVRSILVDTAQPIGQSPEFVGHGRLDSQAAMRKAVFSDLALAPASLDAMAEAGGSPFTLTIDLTNPSSDAMQWQVKPSKTTSWLSLPGADNNGVVSGTVSYAQPASVSVVLSPTLLSPKNYNTTLKITGFRSTGSQVVRDFPVNLTVVDQLSNRFLPFVYNNAAGPRWETPDENGREVIKLLDASSIGVLLPFTATLKSRAYTTVRIFSDGYLVFPADQVNGYSGNRCIDSGWPHQAIYAWWTDLDPEQGGQISTFQAAPGVFVVEFDDVPTATGISPSYTVSFQVVLYSNGDIRLNYRDVPPDPGQVTIGAEAADSLFSVQVACVTNQTRLGILPLSGQSLLIQPGDLR